MYGSRNYWMRWQAHVMLPATLSSSLRLWTSSVLPWKRCLHAHLFLYAVDV